MQGDASERLYLFAHRLSKMFRALDAGTGLPPAQLSALITVAAHEPVAIGRVAEMEIVSAQAMTRVVDDLEERGLVGRWRDDRDGRAVVLRVTPRGRAIARNGRARKIAMIERHLQGLDREEKRVVERALELLTPILGTSLEPDVPLRPDRGAV